MARRKDSRPEQSVEAAGGFDVSASKWRFLASIFIIGHLWAVLGRPIEFATQGPTGTSPAAATFYMPIRGYSEFAYLNHGYAFFAPDPGPSHLIRASIEGGSAESPGELLYPDLKRQWPRLLYHRHFMLTEFLHNTFQPSELPPELANDSEIESRWRIERQRYEDIRESFRAHLLTTFAADDVKIQRVEHQLVGLPEFLQGQAIDDPTLYLDLLDEFEDVENPLPRFGVPREQQPRGIERPRNSPLVIPGVENVRPPRPEGENR